MSDKTCHDKCGPFSYCQASGSCHATGKCINTSPVPCGGKPAPKPTTKLYTCTNGTCTSGLNGTMTLKDCRASCGLTPIPTSKLYTCTNGKCIIDPKGTKTSAECNASCTKPPVGTGFNCVSNTCVTPSTGTGKYASKAACQKACGAAPPTPSTGIPCNFHCKNNTDCAKLDPKSYCMIKKNPKDNSCHGCVGPNKPPGPVGGDWCQTQWNTTTSKAAATNCNTIGTCKAPHGIDCCTKPTARYPTPGCPPSNPNCKNLYPCKDKAQAAFCKEFVNNPKMSAMDKTKCPVTWSKCNYTTGECGSCDPRTDPKCMALQQTTLKSCTTGCIKIPKYSCKQTPITPWKLPLSLDDTWSTSETGNLKSTTMWAEGAGPLGEGKNGVSPGLVQYYRGMAEFFCKQTLLCNRLQLRVENPYIDGAPDSTTGKVLPANSVKNIYYPAVTSPIYTELLKNLDPKIVVQFMPWTHEPWLAFKNEAEKTYPNITVDGTCAQSEIPCYSNDPATRSIYGPVPECKDPAYPEVKNGDCWSTDGQQCVDKLGESTCTKNQKCARKTGQKWAGCATLCCDGSKPSQKPKVCDGGSICCNTNGDCPRVPTLTVILADMWNTFLVQQIKKDNYNGPFITGLAFDAEGSGYSASNLAKYSRQAIHSINGGKDYYQLPINGISQHFIISVTQGSSFGGLINNTLGVDPAGNPQKDKDGYLAFSTVLPHTLALIKKRLLGVLTSGVEGASTAPAIADEALPEYYNVIDKCPGTKGSPTLVDSLPNWKYPDFRDTKACGPNFNPYVGEAAYLWQPAGGKPGDTFQCGDPTIIATGCSGGSGPTPPPTPSKPGAYCEHPSDCQSDEACCLCNCDYGDAALGEFGCNCDANGKAKPNSEQPHCCGGLDIKGYPGPGWCAKAGTPSMLNPKCSSRTDTSGVPTPAGDFVKFGQHKRCISTKNGGGCNAGNCDNPKVPSANTGVCGNPNSKESFTTSACSNLPHGTSEYPCCGCGYSPSSIYLSAWNAAVKGEGKASEILWDGTANAKVFAQANLPKGIGPLQHFVTGGMSKEGTNAAVVQFGVLRTCALLSIETSHGINKADCMYPIFPGANMEANCGIPNAFGAWTGEDGKQDFINICDKVQQGPKTKMGVPFGSVGIFSYPLLPNSWMTDSKYNPNNKNSTLGGGGGGSSGGKGINWWWVFLVVLVVGGAILFFWYVSRRRRKRRLESIKSSFDSDDYAQYGSGRRSQM